MKNKKVISFVLGMMCFALTLGICIQIKTVTGSNSIVGENGSDNNELRAEVLRYKEARDYEAVRQKNIAAGMPAFCS